MSDPGSDRISPTAYYTGEVWVRTGLAPRELSTWQGRALVSGTKPFARVAEWTTGRPGLGPHLVARHVGIDAVLERAIAEGRVGQILEIACGLSPRGVRFVARHPSLRYVEADLPAMGEQKRHLLESHGLLREDRHRVVHVDALADGELSIAALVGRELEANVGTAIVTEGLLGYLAPADLERLFTRVLAALAPFPHALFVTELTAPDVLRAPATRAFRRLLGAFTRGRVYLHSIEDVERLLTRDGFVPSTRLPRDAVREEAVPAPGDLAGTVERVDTVRIVTARRAGTSAA